MRHKERLQHGAGVGVVLNAAHKWLYGSLALLVSKSYFECNVLEIILERKHVKLCDIPGIVYLTKQKWEVLCPHHMPCDVAPRVTPCRQVFGRRLAAFWAVVFLAVFALFQVYCITYHDEVLSTGVTSSSTGDQSSRRRHLLQASSNSSAASGAAGDPAPILCPGSEDIPMFILMSIASAYVLFQVVLALMNGVMFSTRPIDEAVYRFGARAPRLALLQQTCPFWDFKKRIHQAMTAHSHDAAVTDGLNAVLQPIPQQPFDSSALDVTDDAADDHANETGALLSFADLLSVRYTRSVNITSTPTVHPMLESVRPGITHIVRRRT